jgi:hypothetical protein
VLTGAVDWNRGCRNCSGQGPAAARDGDVSDGPHRGRENIGINGREWPLTHGVAVTGSAAAAAAAAAAVAKAGEVRNQCRSRVNKQTRQRRDLGW